jgi:hypothetical protein
MDTDGRCKVDRVVDRYGLRDADPRYADIDEGLMTRWTGTGATEAVGYRTLTDWFNRRLLRRVYDERGRETLAGRVEHDYEALTGDDDLRRGEVAESLAGDGIDAEELRGAMVSWGTMRTHLQGCLGGEKEVQGGDWERDAIRMARSFAGQKVEEALSALAADGVVRGVDRSELSVQFQLRCEACPTRVTLAEALDRGYVCADHAGGHGASGQGTDVTHEDGSDVTAHGDSGGVGEVPRGTGSSSDGGTGHERERATRRSPEEEEPR